MTCNHDPVNTFIRTWHTLTIHNSSVILMNEYVKEILIILFCCMIKRTKKLSDDWIFVVCNIVHYRQHFVLFIGAHNIDIIIFTIPEKYITNKTILQQQCDRKLSTWKNSCKKFVWMQENNNHFCIKKKKRSIIVISVQEYSIYMKSFQIFFPMKLILQYTLNKCINWAVIRISAIPSITSIATITWKVEPFILRQDKQQKSVSMHVLH